MTTVEIAELERLLAAYRKEISANGRGRTALSRSRRNLETALVRHADDLIKGVRLANALDVLEVMEVKSAKLTHLGIPA